MTKSFFSQGMEAASSGGKTKLPEGDRPVNWFMEGYEAGKKLLKTTPTPTPTPIKKHGKR